MSWLPGANGDPSNTWAAEISPMLIIGSARSTLFSTSSTLFRLLLDRNLAAFSNWFFGTLPPRACENNSILGINMNNFQPLRMRNRFWSSMALTISCNANLMADLFAPRRNAGSTFITQLLIVMTSRTFTMSKLMNPSWMCAERLIIAAGATSASDSTSTSSSETMDSVSASNTPTFGC